MILTTLDRVLETSLTLKQFQDAQQGYLKVLDLYINNYDIANNDTLAPGG